MFVLSAVAGLIAGLLIGVLTRPRRTREPAGVPITWCGNCGQPTSALCYEHKQRVLRAVRELKGASGLDAPTHLT
ncbi:hypothetical protein Cme02nite_71320 [Catellatospora methionotrophica]|uniref:Uncharacterized protein n=1 Tax=Catellatospora methionotrophica TaxID=121620 RepID=A0A8J3LIE2_9ACTN|nr:hypothetical protein Cme02nite_71320 [Catellatospora methionotrophica]